MSFETETVMTQTASPNARSFSSAITSIVAKSGNPTMKAVHLEQRGGSGALVAARAAHGFRRGKIVLRITESYAPQDARA